MKNILVTGANGFVGNHMIKELRDNGSCVIGVGGKQESKNTPNSATSYMVLDLNDPSDVQKIDFKSVDGVIHLAGLAAVGPSFDHPISYLTTNIGIQVNLFETALRQKANPKFLIISSGALYDSKAGMPLSEISRVLPNSPYAVSKLGQEQLSKYYQTRGFDCVIARPFNHIGPGQGPGFLLPDLVKQATGVKAGTQKTIRVGNLTPKRDYTDVRDIVRAYRLLMEKGTPGEIYNVCSGVPHSGDDILTTVLKVTNINPSITKDPLLARPTDAPVLYGSHDKITRHTGWEPKIAIEATIKDVVEEWAANS